MIPAAVGALLLAAADVAVRAVRLRVLLGPALPARIGTAVVVNALGDAASALTPARLGGEPARFLALRNRGTSPAAAVVVLATERLADMGLAALVGLAAITLLGTRGFGDVTVYVERLASRHALPWVAGVAVLLAGFVAVAARVRGRFSRVGASLRDALAHARHVASGRLLGAVGLTGASMAARIAVLPLLLWGTGAGFDLPAACVGSFALIYAQLLLPTPAGVGGVELGFVLGVAPLLPPAEVAALLVLWRVITVGVPVGLGAVLLARARLLSAHAPHPPAP
jgi:uncharacterized membrane protein YbhN (UPF0104 family)